MVIIIIIKIAHENDFLERIFVIKVVTVGKEMGANVKAYTHI